MINIDYISEVGARVIIMVRVKVIASNLTRGSGSIKRCLHRIIIFFVEEDIAGIEACPVQSIVTFECHPKELPVAFDVELLQLATMSRVLPIACHIV